MFGKRAVAAFTAGVVFLGASVDSQAASISAFSTDFESGLPTEFSGGTTIQGTQGFSSLPGFDSNFYRNVNGPDVAVLKLTGLQDHTSISLSFLLAIIDSWDGSVHNDRFNVSIDGIINPIFSEQFAIASGTQTYLGPKMSATTHRGFWTAYPEDAYEMSLDNIAHTGTDLTIRFFGSGLQAISDESWAIDQVEVKLNGITVITPVPEPSTMLLLATGLLGLIGYGRRKASA